MLKIRSEKDFWAGALYVALGAAFYWFARNYSMGAAARMGPGYFPIVLSWILMAFGTASIIRSFMSDGDRIGRIAFRPLIAITVSIVIFAWLVQRAGLIFALPILVFVSSLASQKSEYSLKSALILVGLAAFCILVFVKFLGVPMPIFGAWFDGIVPSSWQR